MANSFSTVIKKKKWKEIAAVCGIERDITRSYKMQALNKASIILDNEGIQCFDAEWGLIPEWSRSGSIRGTLIHARYENLLTSPSFRIPIRQKRCLIPVDSYYIWHKINKKKVPYRVMRRDEQPMFIAGLWDKWYSRYGALLTFSIITNDSAEYADSLGDRVPMVFQDLNEGIEWLQMEDYKKAVNLLQNPLYENLKIYRISDKFRTLNTAEIHKEMREEVTLFD